MLYFYPESVRYARFSCLPHKVRFSSCTRITHCTLTKRLWNTPCTWFRSPHSLGNLPGEGGGNRGDALQAPMHNVRLPRNMTQAARQSPQTYVMSEAHTGDGYENLYFSCVRAQYTSPHLGNMVSPFIRVRAHTYMTPRYFFMQAWAHWGNFPNVHQGTLAFESLFLFHMYER